MKGEERPCLGALDDPAAEHSIAIVKYGGLAGTECTLRLMESQVEPSVPRRYEGGSRRRRRITNLHLGLNRLLIDSGIQHAEIAHVAIFLGQLIFRA